MEQCRLNKVEKTRHTSAKCDKKEQEQMNRKTKKAAGIKQMTIRVPAEVHRLLKVKAAEDGQTVSGIAIALLQGYLKGKSCP